MGLGLTLLDDDTVSNENLGTQFHFVSDVGRDKADAVTNMVERFVDDVNITAAKKRVGYDANFNTDIVISAVDSIASRKELFWATRNSPVPWFMDTRMSAEEFHLYVVKMIGNTRWYEDMIAGENDQNVPELPCTSKATIYLASVAAGIIGAAVKTIAIGQTPAKKVIFQIPNHIYLAEK